MGFSIAVPLRCTESWMCSRPDGQNGSILLERKSFALRMGKRVARSDEVSVSVFVYFTDFRLTVRMRLTARETVAER